MRQRLTHGAISSGVAWPCLHETKISGILTRCESCIILRTAQNSLVVKHSDTWDNPTESWQLVVLDYRPISVLVRSISDGSSIASGESRGKR